ncbi:hypothetical protein ACLOJK_023482 [Asimina triloba]
MHGKSVMGIQISQQQAIKGMRMGSTKHTKPHTKGKFGGGEKQFGGGEEQFEQRIGEREASAPLQGVDGKQKRRVVSE